MIDSARLHHVISAIGVVFGLIQIGEVILISSNPALLFDGYIAGVLTGLPFTIGIIYGGYWLAENDFSTIQYKRITGWTAGGVIGFVALITIMVLITGTPDALYLASTVRWAGSIGGSMGMVIGVFAARGQSLERQRDRFETLFETLPEPVVLVSGERQIDATIARVNPAFEETFGYQEDEIVGEHLDDIIVPENKREEAEQINQRHIQEGLPPQEVRRETADGERRDFLLLITTFTRHKEENIWEGFAIYADITERKDRERRLDEFAGIVSHDLRNPLNVARGRLELAQAESDSEHLDAVSRALDRMATLIDDLLILAREGMRPTDIESVELAAVADTCWSSVQTHDARLVTETNATIRSDPSRLEQLLENLIRNAVEHGGTDVTVEVGDVEDGFYVADNGPGIPEDQREQVFDTGFTTEQDGTGFGLSIVREIVDAHGWEIQITDSDDGGARFVITGVDIES